MSAAPRVGVVIVNYNAGEYLALAVESLLAQTTPPHRIVVVDNASPTVVSAERFPSVELVAPGRTSASPPQTTSASQCADCELRRAS